MQTLLTYTRYHSEEDAQFLTTLLQQHNIPYSLEHEVNQLDKVYAGEMVDPMFVLRVPNDRFNDVNNLLADQATFDMARPDFEHYLLSYSVTELKEIIRQPDGWNAYDLAVAHQLLADQGQDVPAENVLSKDVAGESAATYVPEQLDKVWIALGYLSCIAAFTSILGLGAAGFFAGLAIVQSKKTLRNGDVVRSYSRQDRQHGKFMMVLSIVMLLVGSLVLLYRRSDD